MSLARLVITAVIVEGRANVPIPVLAIQVDLHTRHNIVEVDVVSAVDLLRKQREKFVVTALADPNLGPRVTVR